MEILNTDQSAEWRSVLTSMKAYDFYYLPSYHKLAETQGEGAAELFVHRYEKYTIAIPLLLRPVSEIQGLEKVEKGLNDATSVYGYAGPLASDWNMPVEVIKNFQIDLCESLKKRKVVSVFSRLHPLFPQQPLLHGLGSCKSEGQTISIDLSLTPEDQVAQYGQSHKKGIKKLRAMGVECFCDLEFRYLDDLLRAYYETMERAHAASYYFFPEKYFQDLRGGLRDEMRLFVCRLGGETICAALFVLCDGIIQGHLGGTRNDFTKYSPMKLMFDTVREWGNTVGARIFHVGGGVGANEDALFQFKAGFSHARHQFFTWRWILSESDYSKLTTFKTGISKIDFNRPLSDEFFPAYRAPKIENNVVAKLAIEANPICNNSDSSPSIVQKSIDLYPAAENIHIKNHGTEIQPSGEVKKKNARVLVVGVEGQARVIGDAIAARSAKYGGMELVGFLDDDPAAHDKRILVKSVLGTVSDIKQVPHDVIVIGIGDNEGRQKLYEDLSKQGEKFISVIHPNATVARDVKMGRGTVIFAGVVVNTGAKIGDNVILNTGCTIGHDCMVGSHTHICSGVNIGGTVQVRKGAFVGIGSAIIQNKIIGEWSIVGAGATVIKDVPPRTIVVGVPAQVLIKESVVIKKQMGSIRTITLDSKGEWTKALSEVHDFYYLPFYHELAKDMGQGKPILFVYEYEGYRINLPLLIRRIGQSADGSGGEQWFDATSVYGYSGPLTSHTDIPDTVKRDFQELLTSVLVEMKIVSLFARLHPLLNQIDLISGLGVVINNGNTISIDLSLPEQMQLAQYRRDHRRGIRLLRDMGATCEIDDKLTHLGAFTELYYRNMKRVGAKPDYFFPSFYFNRLMSNTEAIAKLFVCKIEGDLACAGIFLKCGKIIQYHLSATSEKYIKYAPTKLLLDTARQWGVEQSAATLHLGGGVGSSEDELFKFKAGFSQIRHEFFTWRWILSESEYGKLTSSKAGTNEIDIKNSIYNGFFPAYRK